MVSRLVISVIAVLIMLPGEGRQLAASGWEAVAHPVSITQADIYVKRNKMTMRLTAFADDLELIQGVEAYDDGKYDSAELRQAFRDHGDFLLEKIEIFDASGERLTGKIVEYREFEIPPEGLMSGDLMEHTIGFTFEYELEKQPDFLTFKHHIVDENFLFPSELKLLVKQAGSDVPYAASLKPRVPETIPFDWEQPLSREATGDELRDWFERQSEKTLGITSYGSVYSFIYITPTEVRQEVLIPLANLAAMIDFQQADPNYLEIEEQDDARLLIEGLFSTGNPVEIDGRQLKPRFDRVDFYGLDIRDFAMQAEKRRVNLANGRVGIIMSYPAAKIPQTVTVTWDKFSKTLKDVEAVVIALDEVEKTKFSVYLSENTYQWKNPGVPPLPEIVETKRDLETKKQKVKIPILSVFAGLFAVALMIVSIVDNRNAAKAVAFACVLGILAVLAYPFAQVPITFPGAAVLPTEQRVAQPIFEQLHRNLFRAFDFYEEDDVYEALAASTSGPLLQEFYLRMRKSLEVKEQGGAVANIEKINILDGALSTEPAGKAQLIPPDFAYRCKWNLVGTIEHWGHIHQRTNTYDAVFNIENIDGSWKFTGYDTIDEQQGVVRTSRRKLKSLKDDP